MKNLFTILLLTITLGSFAQVDYGNKWAQAPSRTLVLNDYGIRPNTPADAAKIETVFRYAAAYGYRVTGYGEFDGNNDTVTIKGLDLWAANKGSFILRNWKNFTPKEYFKAENVVFKDFSSAARGVVFWDTVKDAGGNIISDMWPERGFRVEVKNCDVDSVSNFFYCQQDIPVDSAWITGYITDCNITNIRYSGIKLPMKHMNLEISRNYISKVTNGGANFSAGINVGLDNTFNRGGAYGFKAEGNRLENLAPDAPEKTTYAILAYTNGGKFINNQINNVVGPLYAAGIDNSITGNKLRNDSANRSDHGIIVKGGIKGVGTLLMANNDVTGKYGTCYYLDHAGDVATLTGNIGISNEDTSYVGQGALRILSHGFNSIQITGGHYENRQTNSAVSSINISTDDTIGTVSIMGAEVISEGYGFQINSQMIRSLVLTANTLIYSKLPNTIKTAGTRVETNTVYYPKSGTHFWNVNSSTPIYFENNTYKPWYKDTATTGSIGRIYNVDNDAATDSSFIYATNNKYDLSFAGVAFYVQNPTYIRLEDEKLTGTSDANANFMNVRFNAGFMDIVAKNVNIPFSKQFITCGLGTAGQTARLEVYNSFLTGSVVTFSSATQADITKELLVIKGGSVPSTAYGTGWASTDVPGSVGTGDVISNAASTTDGYIAVAQGTGAKTIRFESTIDVAARTSGTLPWNRVGVTGTGDSTMIVHADGIARTPGTFTGITAVTHDGTLSGDGNTTPLSVDTTSSKLKKFVQENGGGGATGQVYVDEITITGGSSAGDPARLKEPGGIGNHLIRENIVFVTATSYNVTSSDVEIFFTGTANTTFTLPAFNSVNRKRVLYITNASAFTITLDKSIYISTSSQTPEITAGQTVKLTYHPTADQIWRSILGQ